MQMRVRGFPANSRVLACDTEGGPQQVHGRGAKETATLALGRILWASSALRVARSRGVCEPWRVTGVVIVEVPKERLDELEPLWRALHDHHDEVSPHLHERKRPYDRSWESRRQSERALLQSEPGSFALAALKDDRYVGYAFVRIRPGVGFAATWTISDPYAELYTLSVLPACRGQLIGSALMDAVESRLRELRVADMIIGVVATNLAAIEFYE